MRGLLAATAILTPTLAHAGWLGRILGGKEPEPEPEKVTILGMDPLLALALLIIVLGSAVAIYHKPEAFMRGFAEMMGATMAWFVGIIVIAGGLVLYLEVATGAALGIVVILALVFFLAFIGFLGSQ